jgi:hypothetical protein
VSQSGMNNISRIKGVEQHCLWQHAAQLQGRKSVSGKLLWIRHPRTWLHCNILLHSINPASQHIVSELLVCPCATPATGSCWCRRDVSNLMAAAEHTAALWVSIDNHGQQQILLRQDIRDGGSAVAGLLDRGPRGWQGVHQVRRMCHMVARFVRTQADARCSLQSCAAESEHVICSILCRFTAVHGFEKPNDAGALALMDAAAQVCHPASLPAVEKPQRNHVRPCVTSGMCASSRR